MLIIKIMNVVLIVTSNKMICIYYPRLYRLMVPLRSKSVFAEAVSLANCIRWLRRIK